MFRKRKQTWRVCTFCHFPHKMARSVYIYKYSTGSPSAIQVPWQKIARCLLINLAISVLSRDIRNALRYAHTLREACWPANTCDSPHFVARCLTVQGHAVCDFTLSANLTSVSRLSLLSQFLVSSSDSLRSVKDIENISITAIP